MNDFVASFFKFQERKTTWQRETIGGITSFVTMARISFSSIRRSWLLPVWIKVR